MNLDNIVRVIRDAKDDAPFAVADHQTFYVTIHEATAEQITTVIEQTGDCGWRVDSSGSSVWITSNYGTMFMRDATVRAIGTDEARAFAGYLVTSATDAYNKGTEEREMDRAAAETYHDLYPDGPDDDLSDGGPDETTRPAGEKMGW